MHIQKGAIVTDETLWHKLDDIIFGIYQAENIRDLRLFFLNEMVRIIPHDISFFDLKGRRKGKEIFFDPVTLTIDKGTLGRYYSDYIEKDYTSWATSQMEDIVVYRDSDFISDDARQRSVLYREWLQPMGIVYGCGINVFSHGIGFGTVAFGRSRNAGDFTDDELEILSIVARHLSERFYQLHPTGVSYAAQPDQHQSFEDTFNLTPREREICAMVCDGLLPAQIGAESTITVNTVNRHIANIYKKTGVDSRSALLRKVLHSLGRNTLFE